MVIPREALEAIPELEQGFQPVLTDENGAYVPLQADDLDGDGNWDELFIVTDLDGGEEIIPVAQLLNIIFCIFRD